MKTLSLLFLTVNILLNIWHSESSCPENQDDEGSGCECDIGFRLVDDSCIECDEKSYKNDIGNFSCAACPDNSVSINRLYCECSPGFTNGRVLVPNCVECFSGFYKAGIGNETCTECPEHSTCYDDRTGFTCNAGFELNGTVCVECDKGFYKAKIGNETCKKCPDHSTSNDDRTGFTCNAGYATDNNDCVCDKGFYKAENGNSACKKCSTFFTTESIGSTDEESCNVKKKGLIAGVTIAVIIAICTIVVVIFLIIKSERK